MHFKYFFISVLVTVLISSLSIQAQSPTAAAGRFNIFVQGDVTLASNETEGAIAVGGNLISNQHQISFNKSGFKDQAGMFTVKNAVIGLAVRGGIKLNSGTLTINGGNYVKIGACMPSSSAVTNLTAWYKDRNNAESSIRINGSSTEQDVSPNIIINANASAFSPKAGNGASENSVCENVFGTGDNRIDIDNAFITFVAKSAQMAALTDNVAIRNERGEIVASAPVGPYLKTSDLSPTIIGNNPKIVVDPTKLNVLTVSAAVWEYIRNYNIEGIPQGASMGQASYTGGFGLVVNIVDFSSFASAKGNSTINFPSLGGLSDSQGSYVIYNFPDATGSVTVGGNSQIVGTIFTPQAHLIKGNNGNINGQIIAKSYVHQGDEVHFWPFLVPVTEEKKITVVAGSDCFKNAPWLDYSVTPNFEATGSTAKIEWINSDGTIVAVNDNQPLIGRILFPGAAVDDSGTGIAWPGWEFIGGKWQPSNDLVATICDAGARVRITVNANQTVEVPSLATPVRRRRQTRRYQLH